jgi:lysophospholipase L1-like esterase
MKSFNLILPVILLIAFASPAKTKITIFLAGDSTMSIKETKAYPETGWGMPFVYFWDSSVTVINRAKNGRSTKTFITEGLWQSIYDEVRDDDYVFIQFGHNDEVPTKKSYTTKQEFHDNLVKYIKESRSKKAIPVLLTPVARRKFDSTGRIEGTHDVYSQIVRDVAASEKVGLIDLDKKSQALYQQFGPGYSKLLFLQLNPNEHPNYPEGKNDNTHFNELGARLVAEIVLNEIRELGLDLSERIVKPVVSK